MGLSHPDLYDSWLQFLVMQIVLIPVSILICPIEKIHSFFAFRNIFGRRNNLEKHKEKVKRVQEEVRKWGLEGKPKGLKMCSGRRAVQSISLNPYDKNGYYQIDIGALKDVVEIDEQNKTVTVEPGMTMGRLTKILTNMGWSIPVVPELPTLTVGGLIAGAGLETSSHKYGLFSDTVLRIEILCPDGEVVDCSENDHPDLFHAIPGSYGTLGFLTAVTLPIIPAGRWVKLEYQLFQNIEDAIQKINTSAKQGYDFIEGFAISKNKIIILSGNMTDNAETTKINNINAWYKPCFYLQAEEIANKLGGDLEPSETYYEYIPLPEYYHRHTRGTFWLTLEAFPWLKTHQWIYKIFGWTLPTDVLYFRSFCPNFADEQFRKKLVVQDYIIESSKVPEFYESCDEILGIYPVWLCPLSLTNEKTMFTPLKELGIDIGYYGFPKSKGFHNVETLKQLEQLTMSLNGYLGLYADNFMTKQDFCKMFDTDLYNKMRKERGCLEAFPKAWKKACSKSGNCLK